MESNLVIKVKYGDTLRRFNARTVDSGHLDLNMAGLREKIIGLFNFPFETQLSLTYVDEDGDIVTLVDDDDLCDVMRQRLKFLRINVQPYNDKLNKPHARSSGGSTPLRSPSVQPPLPSFNTDAADVVNSVPEHFRDALTEVFSKLSVEVASKAASASPLLGDLVESLSKVGQSYLSPASQSGVVADSSKPVGSPDSPSAPSDPTGPDTMGDGISKVTAVDSSSKTSKESNCGNASGAVDGTVISDPAAVDLNADPHDDNLTRYTTLSPGPSACNTFAHNDKKNTKEKNRRIKGKSVSIDTSTPFIDTSRRYYPSNECPFSGLPVANDSNVPPYSYHPSSPSKRSFVSTEGNGMFNTFHKGIQCDGCGVLPITGPRFKSKVKDNYDLCSICFSKMGNDAEYIRMDKPQHYRHPWCFRASNNHFQGVAPELPRVLRNRVLKLSRPKLESHFILDVNVLDGSVMAPSTPFTKIWRMRNNGTLPWYRGMQLVWIGGDKLTNAISVDIEIPAEGVPLDGELDIAVDFTAPELPGRYVSYWRMASETGIKFGQRVWVLIHVDASLKDSIDDNLQGLNLNLPPENSAPMETDLLDMNVDLVTEPCNSNASPVLVSPMVAEQSTKEQLVNINDVLNPVPTSSVVSYPIIDQGGVVVPVSRPPTLSLSELYPTSDKGASAPVVPQTTSSSVSYPKVDFFDAAPSGPYQVPHLQTPTQEKRENTLEQTLLKELEDMGFKQADLNKDILRRNEYDLEKSVDDLCGVSEWDPILEELQEMGFCDAEVNRKLLKKNNGSIKGVVMDLLTGEVA
ncbi:Arabidopsis thaliana next to BRCA1 gene 1, next to BRCA1 gene 1 [Hibiscus trionum]|uniref:Arabidopsis thaliana next to BRCA1 gene 1, next to BRCA1 gene 1 n=1 Tax=Hibiscus trionum TaxID=183268 RepID=A0A9W7HDT0_HIBTR|nr:Arabidopsis thaliana next to BRCA1 gene 1, next to BRCA1 gene 1 [Hibiscus trionum]